MSIPTNYAPAKQFTRSETNSQPRPDEYAKAVRLWNEGNAKRFEFAEEAAGVVGNYDEGKSQDLADRIGESLTTVQNHAKVGKFWMAILNTYSSDAEVFRDELQIGYWLPVARLWANKVVTLAGAFQWLKICRSKRREKGFNIEKFKLMLPNSDGTETSEYGKAVKQLGFRVQLLMVTVDELMTAPSFDADPEVYKEFYAALKQVKELAPRVMRVAFEEAQEVAG